MTFVAFSAGAAFNFMLPLVSFVAVLKLSRPHIQTSQWVQHSAPGFFFIMKYWFVSIDFMLWKLIFACPIFYGFQSCCFHCLILKYPSIWIDSIAWVYISSWRCWSVDTLCFNWRPVLLSFCCSIPTLSFSFLFQHLISCVSLLYYLQPKQCHQCSSSCLRFALLFIKIKHGDKEWFQTRICAFPYLFYLYSELIMWNLEGFSEFKSEVHNVKPTYNEWKPIPDSSKI